MYVYVFLAVNQYANEAWSVILLQLISVNPPSPGLGSAHTRRHALVNTTHTLVFTHWLVHYTCKTYKPSFACKITIIKTSDSHLMYPNYIFFFPDYSDFNGKTLKI